MFSQLLIRVALLTAFLVPTVAQADLFSIYVAGKTGFVDGAGDAFDYFDGPIGKGAEAGIELIGVDARMDSISNAH